MKKIFFLPILLLFILFYGCTTLELWGDESAVRFRDIPWYCDEEALLKAENYKENNINRIIESSKVTILTTKKDLSDIVYSYRFIDGKLDQVTIGYLTSSKKDAVKKRDEYLREMNKKYKTLYIVADTKTTLEEELKKEPVAQEVYYRAPDNSSAVLNAHYQDEQYMIMIKISAG